MLKTKEFIFDREENILFSCFVLIHAVAFYSLLAG